MKAFATLLPGNCVCLCVWCVWVGEKIWNVNIVPVNHVGEEKKSNRIIKPCIHFPFPSPALNSSLHPSIQVSKASWGRCISPDLAAENVEIRGPGPNRPDEFSHENTEGGERRAEERGIDGEENRADCDGWQGLGVILHRRLSNSWATYGYGLRRTAIFLFQHAVVLKRLWRRDLKNLPLGHAVIKRIYHRCQSEVWEEVG